VSNGNDPASVTEWLYMVLHAGHAELDDKGLLRTSGPQIMYWVKEPPGPTARER
jgi:hypothetical protein